MECPAVVLDVAIHVGAIDEVEAIIDVGESIDVPVGTDSENGVHILILEEGRTPEFVLGLCGVDEFLIVVADSRVDVATSKAELIGVLLTSESHTETVECLLDTYVILGGGLFGIVLILCVDMMELRSKS